MTTMLGSSTRRQRFILYIIIAVAVVVLMVAGLIVYRSAKSTPEARAKADQLIAVLQKAGVRTPSRNQIVRVLGEDGGPVCANPAKALNKAILLAQLANGAGGPGTRPVIADSRILKGELLVIQIYCPGQLSAFQQLVSQLKSANVTGG